jgi:hypothetical protein
MGWLDVGFLVEVGDGSGDFDEAVVAAGGEVEFGTGDFEEVFHFPINLRPV